MIIHGQMTTEKQKTRNQKKAAKRQSKRNRLQCWHKRFVIFKVIEDWENNKKETVWFETIERKGRWIPPAEATFEPHWRWSYRLPQNENGEPERAERVIGSTFWLA